LLAALIDPSATRNSAQALRMDEPSGTRTSTEITEPPSPSLVDSVAASIPSRLEEPPPTRPAKSESRLQHASSGTNGSSAPPANEAASNFWLSHSDQAIFAVILLVMLVLLAAYWVRVTRWGTVPIEIDRLPQRQVEYRIDVNSATWVEWGQLEGIGDSLARRIVADREQNGPFGSIDELRRVKGIGPKTLERIRPWVTIGSDSAEPDDNSASASSKRSR
jgi:competence protein ComEA